MKCNHELEISQLLKAAENCDTAWKVRKALIEHFWYSVKDINSYDELTPEEKSIIPEKIFKILTNKESAEEAYHKPSYRFVRQRRGGPGYDHNHLDHPELAMLDIAEILDPDQFFGTEDDVRNRFGEATWFMFHDTDMFEKIKAWNPQYVLSIGEDSLCQYYATEENDPVKSFRKGDLIYEKHVHRGGGIRVYMMDDAIFVDQYDSCSYTGFILFKHFEDAYNFNKKLI